MEEATIFSSIAKRVKSCSYLDILKDKSKRMKKKERLLRKKLKIVEENHKFNTNLKKNSRMRYKRTVTMRMNLSMMKQYARES